MTKTVIVGLLIAKHKNNFEIWKMIREAGLPQRILNVAYSSLGRMQLDPNDPYKVDMLIKIIDFGDNCKIETSIFDEPKVLDKIPLYHEGTYRNTRTISIQFAHWDQIVARKKLLGIREDNTYDSDTPSCGL